MTSFNPLNPFYLQYDFRDWFGYPDGPCIRGLEFLQVSGCCYVPRLYKVPDISVELLPPDGYVATTVAIPAGSWLLGMKPNIHMEPFMLQITDLSLNRQFYSAPVSSLNFVYSFGEIFGVQVLQTNDQIPPALFTAPYPVVSSGNFQVEIWRIGGTINSIINVCLLTAEIQQ